MTLPGRYRELPSGVHILQAGLVVNALGNGAAAPFLILYLHNVRGIPLPAAGVASATAAGCGLAAALVSGRVADRLGPRRTMFVGLGVSALAYALYPLVRQVWHTIVLGAVAGVGIGTWLTTFGALFLLNSVTIIAVQVPAARAVEGRARMRVLALMGVLVAGAWVLVSLAGGGGPAGALPVLVGAILILSLAECLHDAVQGPLVVRAVAGPPVARPGAAHADPPGRADPSGRETEFPMKWITRARPRTDRIACPWLVRRFIDPDAEFVYVDPEQVLECAARVDGVSFDAPGATYGHRRQPDGGQWCTFETILHEHNLASDPALVELARIIHAADIAADADSHPFGPALRAIGDGGIRVESDDLRLLERGLFVYDALYAYCQRTTADARGS